jgi:hypothetical protein
MKEKKVKVKDYEEKKHLMMAALGMVGIHVDYNTIDIISETLDVLAEKGGKFLLSDAIELKHNHEKKWDNYFKQQEQ